ncbi:hypothetical protein Y032_0202g1760 [Ancylostoma ceylanicum]|uniref:SWIM-type domain-containing protein n=1 Tax=Ancylostoma ceylanicum TaxID=53326 RepID=A0A016SM84_9BILA|nr:hypothetical protein Y032_0202g1760 [Ancylostoma ceylanicum]
MIALLLLLLATDLCLGLECYHWNDRHLRKKELNHTERPFVTQCLFQLDFPCDLTNIQKSARYSYTIFAEPLNSCIIGRKNDTNVICTCRNRLCTSDCRHLVEIWKKSKAYDTSTGQAKCMEAYERECYNGKVLIGKTGGLEGKNKRTESPKEQTVLAAKGLNKIEKEQNEPPYEQSKLE